MSNSIYAIVDSKTGVLVPKTHYFCLKDDVEAVYTLINFASMLNNRFVSLIVVGVQSEDLCSIKPLDKPKLLTDFLGIPDYLEQLSAIETYDAFYAAGISKDNLSSAFSFALENILLREEKLGIMKKLSGDLSSFDPKEIEKMQERLKHLENISNGNRW